MHRARVAAAKKRRSLTALVREFLARLAGEDREREASIRRLSRLMAAKPLEVGLATGSREDLHAR